MNKYDLGDPNGWPNVNGQQTYQQYSRLPNGIGKMVVLNNSPYGLDVTTGGDPYRVDAGIGRLLPVDDAGQQMTFTNVYAIPGANANDLRRVTIEIYEPAEPIYEHYPIELIRNTNVLNTVNTGSSVAQTQSVVYDQTAINGEAAGAVNSQAAAGSGAGKVDVNDSNPTGGVWRRQMATGTTTFNADGSINSPAFHGPADSASVSTSTGDGANGSRLTAGDTGTNLDIKPIAGGAGAARGLTLNTRDSGGVLHQIASAAADGTGAVFHGTADSVAAANAVVSTTTLTVGDTWGFPVDSVSGKALRPCVTFGGTGAGTFNHGMIGGQTPNYIGITTTQPNSTETVGVDTITSTSVQVNQGATGWPWRGFAIRA